MKPTIRPIKYKGFEIKFTDNYEDLNGLKGKNIKDLWCIYFNDKKSGDDFGIRLPKQVKDKPITQEDLILCVFEGIISCIDKIDIDILKIYEKTSDNK